MGHDMYISTANTSPRPKESINEHFKRSIQSSNQGENVQKEPQNRNSSMFEKDNLHMNPDFIKRKPGGEIQTIYNRHSPRKAFERDSIQSSCNAYSMLVDNELNTRHLEMNEYRISDDYSDESMEQSYSQ